MTFSTDLREHLGAISCPTLVIPRTGAVADFVEHGRFLSGRSLVRGRDLPRAGHASVGRGVRQHRRRDRGVLDGRTARPPQREGPGHVLFVDIVDSTVRAAASGDRQWRSVLDEYDVNVERLLARYDGIFVKNTGDGSLARSPAPPRGSGAPWPWWRRPGTSASRSGSVCTWARSSSVAMTSEGWPSTSRPGQRPGRARRDTSTGTVRDLVVGSGIVFDDRGAAHRSRASPGNGSCWPCSRVEPARTSRAGRPRAGSGRSGRGRAVGDVESIRRQHRRCGHLLAGLHHDDFLQEVSDPRSRDR